MLTMLILDNVIQHLCVYNKLYKTQPVEQ